MAASEPDEGIAIPLVFIGADETPIIYANQFALQVDRGDFFLTIGQFLPPLVLGDEEEQREQLKQVTHVPVRVVTRIAMSRERALELVALLGRQLQRYDEHEPERER